MCPEEPEAEENKIEKVIYCKEKVKDGVEYKVFDDTEDIKEVPQQDIPEIEIEENAVTDEEKPEEIEEIDEEIKAIMDKCGKYDDSPGMCDMLTSMFT